MLGCWDFGVCGNLGGVGGGGGGFGGLEFGGFKVWGYTAGFVFSTQVRFKVWGCLRDVRGLEPSRMCFWPLRYTLNP